MLLRSRHPSRGRSRTCGTFAARLRVTLLSATLLLLIAGSAGAQVRFTVTTTADEGPGSLRLAIQAANEAEGAAEIAFNISGEPPFFIEPESALPWITSQITIDATTQPGYAGAPLVNVRIAFGPVLSLRPDAANSVISGLSITGKGTTFASSICLEIRAADVHVRRSYIGLTPDGSADGCATGLRVFGHRVQVGGNDPADRVVVGGNFHTGIRVGNLDPPRDVKFDHVLVGLDPTGSESRGQRFGIFLAEAVATRIRNSAIAGSRDSGVWISPDAHEVTIEHSRIGTNARGDAAADNSGFGIFSYGSDLHIDSCQISGHPKSAINLFGGQRVTISRSLIGTDAYGVLSLGNETGVEVGGAGSVQLIGNTISGNSRTGIRLDATRDVVLLGNRIGVNASGDALLINGFRQLELTPATYGTVIGRTEAGEGNTFGVPEARPSPDMLEDAVGIFMPYGTGNTVRTPVGETFALVDYDQFLSDERGKIIAAYHAAPQINSAVGDVGKLSLQYRAPAEATVHVYAAVTNDGLAKRDDDSPGVVRVVAIGTDVYSEEDRSGCGEPPCIKSVDMVSVASLAGAFLLVHSVHKEYNSGEFSDPVEIRYQEDLTSTEGESPFEFALEQNYPNPFNPTTTIPFDVPQQAHVVLKVYDLLGREVAVLVNGDLASGNHTALFDASGLPSGMYVYVIRTGGFTAVRRMVVVK